MGRQPSNSGISASEWIVMDVLWDANREMSAVEVFEILGDTHGWKRNTVITFLARLTGKGIVSARKEGNQNFYRPVLARRDAVRKEANQFVDRVFSGFAGPAVLHFLEEGELSPEDLKAMKEKLEELTDERTD